MDLTSCRSDHDSLKARKRKLRKEQRSLKWVYRTKKSPDAFAYYFGNKAKNDN